VGGVGPNHSPASGYAAAAAGGVAASTCGSSAGMGAAQAPSSSFGATHTSAAGAAATAAAGAGAGREGEGLIPSVGITSPSAEEHVSLADGVAEAFPLLDQGLLAGGGLRAGLRRLQGMAAVGEASQQQHLSQRHQQQLLSPPPSSEPSWHSATSTAPQQQQQEAGSGLCASRSLECVAAAADARSTEEEGGRDQQQLRSMPPPAAAATAGTVAGALKGGAPRPLILPSEASAAPTTEASAASASPLTTPLASPLRRGVSGSATPSGDGSRRRHSQLAQLLLPGSAGPGQPGSGSQAGRTRSRHRRVRSDIPQLYPCPPLDSPLHNAMPLQLTESMSLGALGGCDLGDASPLDTPLHSGLKSPAAMYRRLKGAPWQQQQQQVVVVGPSAAAGAARASPTPLPATGAGGGGVGRLFATPSPVEDSAAAAAAAAVAEQGEVSGRSLSPPKARGSSPDNKDPQVPIPTRQQLMPTSVTLGSAAAVQRDAASKQQPAPPAAVAADRAAAEQGEQLASTAAAGEGRAARTGIGRARKRWGAQAGAADCAPPPQAAAVATAAASQAVWMVGSWLEAAAVPERGLQGVAAAAPVEQVTLHATGPAAEPSWGLGCDSSSGTSLAGSSMDEEGVAAALGWWGGTRVTPVTQVAAAAGTAAAMEDSDRDHGAPAAVNVQGSRPGQKIPVGKQVPTAAGPAAVGENGEEGSRGVGAAVVEAASASSGSWLPGASGPQALQSSPAAAAAAGQPSRRPNAKQLAAQQRIAAALAVAAAEAAAAPDAGAGALPQGTGKGAVGLLNEVSCASRLRHGADWCVCVEHEETSTIFMDWAYLIHNDTLWCADQQCLLLLLRDRCCPAAQQHSTHTALHRGGPHLLLGRPCYPPPQQQTQQQR
jgi:hypothetical protein